MTALAPSRPGPGTFEHRVLQRFAERSHGCRVADAALTRGRLPPPPQPSQLSPAPAPVNALRLPATGSDRGRPRKTHGVVSRQHQAKDSNETSAFSSHQLRAGLSSSSEYSDDSDECLDQLADDVGHQQDEQDFHRALQFVSLSASDRRPANHARGPAIHVGVQQCRGQHATLTKPAHWAADRPLHASGKPSRREQTEHLGMHPWEVRDYYASSRLSSLRTGGSSSNSLASKLSSTARQRLERGYRHDDEYYRYDEDSSGSDGSASSDEEALGAVSDEAFSCSRCKRFFTMDSSVKLCSKRELRQCLRSRRQALRWGLGMLLVLQVVGMSMALGLMDHGDKLPEDLHELPEKYWAAAGLGLTPSEIESRLPPRMNPAPMSEYAATTASEGEGALP